MVETGHEATTPQRTGGQRQRSSALSTKAGENCASQQANGCCQWGLSILPARGAWGSDWRREGSPSARRGSRGETGTPQARQALSRGCGVSPGGRPPGACGLPGLFCGPTRPWGRRSTPCGARWRHGAMINHVVRGSWFASASPATGPGMLESLRCGLRRLCELRLDVDDDGVPSSRARAEGGVPTVRCRLAEMDQRTSGGRLCGWVWG